MAAADPALGLTGYMARDRPQMSAGPDGSGDLSRAARSLEAVQGGVAGQTQAVNSLAMSTQAAALNVSSQMSSLGAQIAGLNMAIARLAGGMGTGMAMTSAPPPPPSSYQPSFSMPSAGAFGGMVAGLSAGAARGLGTMGTGLGFMGGAMTAPLAGHIPVSRTAYGGEMSPGASMYESAVLGSGLGVGRRAMRGMHYDRAREAGAERFGDMFASGAMGLAGGAAHLGAGLLGDAVGSRLLMPALGYSGSGIAGGLAGSVLGGAIMAPVTMSIGEIMKQSGQIRGHGDQYGRNAFRLGERGRPSRGQRQNFGAAAHDLSIQDLSMTGDDVKELTAGMFQGDLTRGVRGAGDASQRLRELSRSVKEMARTLGGSYSEMTRTASELQAIGMTVNPENTRRAMFGAASVYGMTGAEGLQAGMAGAQPFVGMGMGAQGLGIGMMSANAGQRAVQSGALSANEVAAVGGREGANQLTSRAIAGFLQGPAGAAALAGGMTAGGGFDHGNISGMGVTGMLGRGGAMASGSNLMEMGLRKHNLQREMADNPTAALAAMAAMAMDIGKRVSPPNTDPRTAFMAGLRAVTGVEGVELEALAKTIQQTPEANREAMKAAANEASQQVSSDIAEQKSVLGRAGREVKSLFQPFAEGVSENMAGLGNRAGDAVSGLGKSWYGKHTAADFGASGEGFRDLIERTSELGDKRVEVDEEFRLKYGRNRPGAKFRGQLAGRRAPTSAERELADKLVASNSTVDVESKISRLKARFKDSSSSTEKAKIARQILDLLTGGGKYPEKMAGAVEDAASRRVGIGLTDALADEGMLANVSAVSAEDQDRYDKALGKIAKATDHSMSKDAIEKIIGDKDVQAYLSKAHEPGVDERELLKMREDMTGDKRALVEKLWASDMEHVNTIREVGGLRANESRARGAASRIGDALTKSGVGGGAGLGSQHIGAVMEAMGDLGLSPDDLARVKEAGAGRDIIDALTLGAGGEVSDEQRAILKARVGEKRAAEMLSDDNLSAKEVAEARLMILGGSGQGRVTVANRATLNQTAMMLEAAAHNERLAKYTVELATIVDRIKKP